MDNVGRRKFIGLAVGGLASMFAAALAWPLYRFLAPRQADSSAGKVVIPLKDVPEGEAKFFEYAGASAVLVRKSGGGVAAFSAVCTHLGCIVQWEKEKQGFLCPCHAGRYSVDGTVVSGPPPKPLPKLPTVVSDGTVTIG